MRKKYTYKIHIQKLVCKKLFLKSIIKSSYFVRGKTKQKQQLSWLLKVFTVLHFLTWEWLTERSRLLGELLGLWLIICKGSVLRGMGLAAHTGPRVLQPWTTTFCMPGLCLPNSSKAFRVFPLLPEICHLIKGISF